MWKLAGDLIDKKNRYNSKKKKNPSKSGRAEDCTFDDSEHSVRLVQWDGNTQSFQKVLLMKQIGQLLLPEMKSQTMLIITYTQYNMSARGNATLQPVWNYTTPKALVGTQV